jgi:hypothetical protein
MSRSSSIDIKFHALNRSCYDILRIWIEAGWGLNDFGEITFLPVGDNGKFEWASLPYTEDNVTYVLETLQNKQRLDELLGINLQWKDTETGGTLLLYHDQSCSFIANINRRTILDTMQITDVNWYLHKLLTPLLTVGIGVETVAWSEHV